ncbi:MAG TPA: GAF domain-containing protein [Chthonomonas sp.]|uniref:GAF domain-containing protein n=1 Tax=Chthonomonas sp. TaxID=2282153 RepID=UPI002B4ADAAE|nr:GAF domain-containing protein [Chthonomonas sp.]HLI47222.1 GAF domain-containing protein [Chthonomonas sp.]
MRERAYRLRTPRSRRLFAALRRSDDPDVTLLQEELDRRDRQLREAHLLIEQLRAELEEKKEEADALRRVGEATGSAFDLEEMLKVTADIATRITGTDSCQVYLFDPDRQELVLRAADESLRDLVGKIRLKMGEGITGWVARERKPVLVSKDAYKDHRFKLFPEMHEGEFQSMLSVPLVTRGEILGVINVRTRRPREYTRNQVRLLSGIANQVAGAIERSRRFRQLERHAVQLHSLSEVSQAITSNVYLEELLHLFVNMVARTMGYKICTVMLLDTARNELVIKATQAENQEYIGKPNLKVGESIAGKAVAEKRILTVLNVQQSPDYASPEIAQKAGVVSLASVPMMLQGNVIGVLNCYTAKEHVFTKEELAILQALATQAALAVEHAKLLVRSAVIQEMHHRVKNNLQQIASLVRLEMRYSKYTTVEDALNDTLSRILAISSVHELLSRDLDTVSIKKVAESILNATKQSVVPPGKIIHSQVEGDDFLLPLNKATSMALVLNELVQNAVEHGFKNIHEGRIEILLQEQPDCLLLRVTNDGEPLPPGFSIRAEDSLGLSIVETLVRGDLNGTFNLENAPDGQGIIATVRVPR